MASALQLDAVVFAELTTDGPRCAEAGASHRPMRSWLYDPGAALPEPPPLTA